MQRADAQHHHMQNQPPVRQGKTAAVESLRGERIAQLEAKIEHGPQAGKQAQLVAMVDGSPAMAMQRKLIGQVHASSAMAAQRKAVDGVAPREEVPAKPHNTGLPDNLKSGIENLSGMSMDNVKVHYNSSQPAQLNALAYAQGTDIHVAPGQEQHLPHEAWHVVQQAHGRVKPTMQMKESVPVNDDAGLEREADAMGAKAASVGDVQRKSIESAPIGTLLMHGTGSEAAVQRKPGQLGGNPKGRGGKGRRFEHARRRVNPPLQTGDYGRFSYRQAGRTVRRDQGNENFLRNERAKERARTTLYARRIMALTPGLPLPEARLFASLLPVRPIDEIAALAAGRPGHRRARDLVRLAENLPGMTIPDLLILGAANAAITADGLTAIYNAAGPRPLNDIVDLVDGLHHLGAADLATLIAIPLPRPVQHLVTMVGQIPPYRTMAEVAKLCTDLPEISRQNLTLLLRMPQARSVRFLRRIIVKKPNHRTISFMEGLSRLMRDVGVDNILHLASLPPARDGDIQAVVNRCPNGVSIADMATLMTRIPARTLDDIIALATLRTRGIATMDIVALGGAPTYRSGNDLVTLASALAGRTMAEVATIASISNAAGMSTASILQFIQDVAAFHLSAAQIRDAALLPGLLNVDSTHANVTSILNTAHLIANLPNVCTVIQSATNMQPASLITCLRRAPANLPALVTHIASLNAAAGTLNNHVQFNRILANDGLVAAGNDVNTVISGAGNMRIPALISCMLHAPANLGHLVTHIADLNNSAGLLPNAIRIAEMLSTDHLIANGNVVHAVLANVPNLPIDHVLTLIRTHVNYLNQMNTFKADIDRALTGLPNVTAQRMLNVLLHIAATGGMAPLGGGQDIALREAQNFGAATQSVMANRISWPANALYLANLRDAVDSLTGVVWGLRGGTFSRTGWNRNFGGPIYVPVAINGFNLSNHVIAHLLNPQDGAHAVTTSNIRVATGNFSGTVIDYQNGGYRDHYLGNGMTMVCPHGGHDVITIFFH